MTYEGRIFREQIQLLKIFPEEIWAIILKTVDIVDDLENICNASPFFRHILRDTRVKFLFPKVWQNLEGMYRKYCETEYKSLLQENSNLVARSAHKCGICLRRRRKRVSSPILILRLVCRSWCKGVDKFYQNHQIHFKMTHDFETTDNIPRNFELVHYEFYMRRFAVGCFLKHFEETHSNKQRNPFVGRALCIHITFGSSADYHSKILSILRKYGSHVWHARLIIEISSLEPQTYARLRSWLELLPNLKSLRINYAPQMGQETMEISEEQQQSEINMVSLPTLQQLKLLRTNGVSSPIFKELAQKCAKVTSLEVYGNSIGDECLPNLEQLSVTCYTEQDIQNLEKCQQNFHLTKFHMDFKGDTFVKWSRLFALVEKMGKDTLIDTVISLPGPICLADEKWILETGQSLKLNLFSVKRLKLVFGCVSSLDFILPLAKSLECLEVLFGFTMKTIKMERMSQAIELEQTIQFIGCRKRLLESNIWSLFPNLKQIKYSEACNPCCGDRCPTYSMSRRIFTRKEWKVTSENAVVSDCS